MVKVWSDDPEIVKDLKVWASQRDSASTIVQNIFDKHGVSITRNAVIGFAFRNGISIGGGKLSARLVNQLLARSGAQPVVREQPKREEPPQPVHHPVRAVEAPIVVPKPKPALARSVPVPDPSAPLPVVRLAPKSKASTPVEPTGKFFNLFPEPGKGIVLPGWRTCRWIEGDPALGHGRMCADLKEEGSSYCAAHQLRAKPKPGVAPIQKREKARFRTGPLGS